jgi:hypothetical protein
MNSLVQAVVVALISGGGAGIGAIALLRPQALKIRSEARKASVEATVGESAALDDHWKAIIEIQTRTLIEPLQTQVDAQGRKIAKLEADLGEVRTRYWRAIQLIRDLYSHITRHSVADAPPAPQIPAALADDI